MRPTSERRTIRRISEALREKRSPNEFTAAEVNGGLGVHWAGVFLPKHRLGIPSGETERFIRVSRGRYVMKSGS